MTERQKNKALEHFDESVRKILMRYEIQKFRNHNPKLTKEQIEEIINI